MRDINLENSFAGSKNTKDMESEMKEKTSDLRERTTKTFDFQDGWLSAFEIFILYRMNHLLLSSTEGLVAPSVGIEELDGLLRLARASNRKEDRGVPGLEGERGAEMFEAEGEPGVVGGAEEEEGLTLALSASERRNSTKRFENDLRDDEKGEKEKGE